MIDESMLLNPKLLVPVLLGGLVLWAIFIWKEWPQRKERRFWIKLIVSFLGILSLALLVLKPTYPTTATFGKSILLSEGYRPKQLDSLKSKFKRIQIEEYTPGKVLTSVEQTDSLFVLGYGLEPFDLWQVEEKTVTFLGTDTITGWVSIHHNDVITLGDELNIEAVYQNPVQGNWAVLMDNGGNPLDSVSFSGTTNQLVEFEMVPKASGQFEFALVEKDSDGEEISTEPIPVQVIKREPLRILMVNNFPTFETKYLKNFLAENGHEVVVRSQLTRNKFKFEYFNTTANPIYQFTQKSLASFDLVILDTDVYLGLGSASKNALEKSVKEDGIGVFVQPNTSFFRQSRNTSFISFKPDGEPKLSFGDPAHTLVKFPYDFQDKFLLEPIRMDSITVAAYVPKEAGKMGTTMLQNSYQLILDGNQEVYAKLWTQILNAIARRKEQSGAWEGLTQIPRIDQAFQFRLRTPVSNPKVMSDRAVIPLLQDVLVPTHWEGVIYPSEPGWNQLEDSLDSIADFSYYVFDGSQRFAMSKLSTFQANLQQFGNRDRDSEKMNKAQKREPIPSVWFFVVFLLSMGWLWLEPKLGN